MSLVDAVNIVGINSPFEIYMHEVEDEDIVHSPLSTILIQFAHPQKAFSLKTIDENEERKRVRKNAAEEKDF